MDTLLQTYGSADSPAEDTSAAAEFERRQAATDEALRQVVRCLARLTAQQVFAEAMAGQQRDVPDPA